MKHSIRLPLGAIIAVLMAACTSTDESSLQLADEPIEFNTTGTISKTEALSIAGKVLGYEKSSRDGSSAVLPSFEYVVKGAQTRGQNTLPDTLAYVINYSGNKGFAIVSALSIDNPLLAYSENGFFSMSNEVAASAFVEEIEPYLASVAGQGSSFADSISKRDPYSTEMKGSVIVSPQLRINLGQSYPWNYLLPDSVQGCVLGCGAVATSLIMTHCKSSMTCHGTAFDMQTMVDKIGEEQNSDQYSLLSTVPSLSILETGYPLQLSMSTYSEALGAMSQFMSYVAVDINTDFDKTSSESWTNDIYDYFVNSGYNVPTGHNAAYDEEEVLSYVRNKHLVFMFGLEDGKTVGHFWVVDGCSYMWVDGHMDTSTAYLHCNWGWDGSSNGYFSGDVFNPTYPSRRYRLKSYMAVEME